MSEARTCDVCRRVVRQQPLYELWTQDPQGYLPSRDICSPQCLARTAAGDAYTLGMSEADAAHKRAADLRPRRWWQRGGDRG